MAGRAKSQAANCNMASLLLLLVIFAARQAAAGDFTNCAPAQLTQAGPTYGICMLTFFNSVSRQYQTCTLTIVKSSDADAYGMTAAVCLFDAGLGMSTGQYTIQDRSKASVTCKENDTAVVTSTYTVETFVVPQEWIDHMDPKHSVGVVKLGKKSSSLLFPALKNLYLCNPYNVLCNNWFWYYTGYPTQDSTAACTRAVNQLPYMTTTESLVADNCDQTSLSSGYATVNGNACGGYLGSPVYYKNGAPVGIITGFNRVCNNQYPKARVEVTPITCRLRICNMMNQLTAFGVDCLDYCDGVRCF